MAFITADRTKEIKRELKAKFPNLTFSVRNRHYSSVDVTITSGDIDFSDLYENERTYAGVNHYALRREYDQPYGKHTALLREIFEIVNTNNYDNSDTMTDYFDVGFYVDMSIGNWEKPYVYKGGSK